MEHHLVIRFQRSQISEYGVAFNELGNESATCRVLPDDFRHTLPEVAAGVASKLFHVACFGTVVEFFLRPGNKLAHRFNHPVDKRETHKLDASDRRNHQSDVTRKVGLHIRSLHFYRHLAPAQVSHADLADGGCRNRLRVAIIKNFSWRLSNFLDEGLLDMHIVERRAPIEQVEQRVAVLKRQDVWLEGEHLAELDKSAAQIFKHDAQSFWAR